MTKREGLTKQDHLDGLKVLGETHPDYKTYKNMIERKFNPNIKTNLSRADMDFIENIAKSGKEWRKKQQTDITSRFFE
jgi:hypothetical protein